MGDQLGSLLHDIPDPPGAAVTTKAGNMGFYWHLSLACSLWQLQHCPLSAEPFLQEQHAGPVGSGCAQPPLQGAQSSPSPTLCPSPILPHPLSIPEAAEGLGLLHGEGKKAAGSGMWGFISFYPSTFEKIIVQVSTRECRGNAGAARHCTYLQGPPRKKEGRKSRARQQPHQTHHHQNFKKWSKTPCDTAPGLKAFADFAGLHAVL